MTFSDLAKYLKLLEETPSRNTMTEILAGLFAKAGNDEIGKLCYLLQGRVAPMYEAVEFGIADKLMIRAIAEATGKEIKEVMSAFKKYGDLGEVAEQLKVQSAKCKVQSGMTIGEVYRVFMQLTQESGEGSQEKKITLLSDLLSSVDGLSARYIARIPLDKLRLGFSDMTILDALSWMLGNDKSQRSRLEEVYNIRPDIGLLAEQVKEHGVAGLSHVKIIVGAPILASLCQRLPTADEMIKKMRMVAVEPKFDGVRCIGGYTGLFIKNRGYISARDVRIGDFVLTHKGRFKEILAIAKRHKRKEEVIYRLQTMLGDSCIISGDHPVLIYKNGKPVWISVQQLSSADWVVFPKVLLQDVRVGKQLTLEDGAGYKKIISMNDAFFRFLGFWIGDGFSNNSHQSERVGLTFNAKTEKVLAMEYEGIIRHVLKIRNISKNERNGGLNIYWRDSMFRVWLCTEFRYKDKGDHGKCLPDWMFGISRRQFLAFIKGWEEADGTTRHGGGNRITTKEHRLAQKAVLLGSAFQHPIGVRKTRVALHGNKVKTYYELFIPGTSRYVHELSDAYAIKIGSLQKTYVHPKAQLYDFQVEGDESYCTSLAALHNCQIHISHKSVKTFSRNMENTTEMFPELLHAGSQLNASEVILDSEAVGMDPATGNLIPFQETMTRKRKHGIAAQSLSVPLKFFVFDILYKDGKDLLNMPLKERRSILERTLRHPSIKLRTRAQGKLAQDSRNRGGIDSGNQRGDLLVISPQIVTDSADRIRSYHDEQIAKGLEGAVVKKWESPYEPGRRGYSWVKFKEEEGKTGKLTDTIDAVVMGYYRGEGKRAGFGIGAFLVGVKKGEEFVTITKIGTGVSDELWKELRVKLNQSRVSEKPKEYTIINKMFEPDVWVDPKVVVEIAGDDLTKSSTHGAGVAVRFPRLVRIRTDKSPGQATTVAELKKMYETQ